MTARRRRYRILASIICPWRAGTAAHRFFVLSFGFNTQPLEKEFIKSFAIAVLWSAAFPALGQDVKSDAAKDGRDLAQQMVTKLHGISSMDTALPATQRNPAASR